MSLEGKVVLVTGASRGIGQAIAKHFAAVGATVVGTATSISGAEQISHLLQQNGSSGMGYVLDVTDANGITSVLEQINNEFGAPSVLINNAGFTSDQLLLRMSDEMWAQVISVHLNAVYRLSKSCLRGMLKQRWGRIINISSVVARSGNKGQANYAAAKAGIEGFTRALAQEVGGRGVTANVVAPGWIDTAMTADFTPELQAKLLAQIPVGRLGKPREIAAAVAFLASDEASYITGATIPVNGGLFMH